MRNGLYLLLIRGKVYNSPQVCIQCPNRDDASLYRTPQKNVAYKYVLTFTAVIRVSNSSYLDGLWDCCTATVLWGAACGICSKQRLASLFSSPQAFPSCVLLETRKCIHTVVLKHGTAWKKSHFISSDFHMIDNLSIIIHAFSMHLLTLLSVDEILLSKDYHGL